MGGNVIAVALGLLALAQTPAAEKVPVEFEAAAEGDRFTVLVDGDEAQRCDTPCALPLAPGEHLVQVRGEGRFRQRFEVWSPGVTVRVHRHQGLFSVLGAVAIAGGVGLTVASVNFALGANGLGAIRARNVALGVAGAGLLTATLGSWALMRKTGRDRLEVLPAIEKPMRPLRLEAAAVVPLERGGWALAGRFSF
jgi:hypothetical protein